MDRREYLKQIALLTGAAVVGADLLLSGCTTKTNSSFFSKSQQMLLDEIGETILPATDTPGAKAADIGSFMDAMVRDCYTKEQQQAFSDGLRAIEEQSMKLHGHTFEELSSKQRHELLVRLEKEAKDYNGSKEKDKPVHYYTMMKQLTLWGFFTSQTGMTQTLRHIPVPGKYDGAYPYAKGEKAWAE